MEIKEKIINVMSDRLDSILKELDSLDKEFSGLQAFSKNLSLHNSSYSYPKELFVKIYPEGDFFQKFYESIYILDRVDATKLSNEPQLKDMQEFINNVQIKLYLLIHEKEKEFLKLKEDYQRKKKAFDEIKEFLEKKEEYDRDKLLTYLKDNQVDDELISLVNEHYEKQAKQKEEQEKIHDTLENIPFLDEDERGIIEQYIKKLYQLDIREKSMIINVGESLKQDSNMEIDDLVYGFSPLEVKYYIAINELVNFYVDYKEITSEKSMNEAKISYELAKLLDSLVKDSREKMFDKLMMIQNYEIDMQKKDEDNDENTAQNLVIFLDMDSYDKSGELIHTSVADLDLDTLASEKSGELEGDTKRIMRMLDNRFLSMPNVEFKKLGHDANKRIINYQTKLFDYFNVWCSKGMVNDGTRIPYFIMSVSEKNQKEIKEKYHLTDDMVIYLVIGLFVKKNDNSEYVKISTSRLAHEFDKIEEIKKIFKEDFTDKTRKKAFALIDKSNNIMNSLHDEYVDSLVK